VKVGGTTIGSRQAFRPADAGASEVLVLVIAGAVFAATFMAVVQFSLHQADTGSTAATNLESDADRIADTILSSAGVGWYADPACSAGKADADQLTADEVQRLGLAPESCASNGPARSINLSFEKLQNLGSAAYDGDPANGHLDYEEARGSLGLETSPSDFHLRSWPVMADASGLLASGNRDPYERVAYIGSYSTLGGSSTNYVVQKACGRTDGATSADVWVDITNNGTTSVGFEVSFQIPLKSRTVEVVRHTGILAPLATQRVSETLTKTSDWQWASASEISVTVSDMARALGSCVSDFNGITMTAAAPANKLAFVHAEKLQNILSGGTISPKVYYDAYDGQGKSTTYSGWKLEIVDALGLVVASDTNLHSRGWESFTLVGPATYTAKLETSLGAVLGQDTINVIAAPLSAFMPGVLISGFAPNEPVVPEAAYLASLVSAFTPNVFSSTYSSADLGYAADGDVFPDLKTVLNNDLAAYLIDTKGTQSPNDDEATTTTYNIIVVGSNVDQNAMTSAAAKQTIRDWVYAGGTLIVFGSSAQNVQWLEPIFHAAIDSASDALLTPDATHPILHTPNDLDYTSYSSEGNIWEFTRDEDADHFSHVIKQGSGDILSVSNAGEFGLGRVILTSYLDYNLQGNGPTGPCTPAAPEASCPALQILHNFLTFSYRDLFLDYGPPLPAGASVGVAHRLATVYHPGLSQSLEVVVYVYVF